MSVGVAFGLKKVLEPVTGTGAPFVLFFGAVVVTSVWAGAGPGVLATLLSIPLGGYVFVVRAGYRPSQAITQAALFAVDGIVVVYLSLLLTRARQRAERSDAWHRDLVDLAPDAFFLADLDGRLTDVNQGACRLLGYERNELVGKMVTDLIPSEDAPRLARVRQSLLAPGRIERSEWRQLRKDGTIIPVEVSACIIPGGRWQAFARDISERKRSEDERQVYVSLLDAASDFIGIADPTGKPIYLNPAGRRMVGLPPDFPVEATEIPQYYAEGERAFAVDVILTSMRERGRWSGETHFRHWQTEAAIPVSDESFLIHDPSGHRVLGMGTITRDISAARQAAREREELLTREQRARVQVEQANGELRESEERFRLTIDEAPIGMALVALDGRFLRVNRRLCEIVGYTADELVGLTFQAITHPDDLGADLALASQLLSGEIPRYELEKRYVRKDGRAVDVSLSGSLLRSPEGRPIHYIAQIEEITERKRLASQQRFLAEIGPLLASTLDYQETLKRTAEIAAREIADVCVIDILEGDGDIRRIEVAGRDPAKRWVWDGLKRLTIDARRPFLLSEALRTHSPVLLERPSRAEIDGFAQSDEHRRLLRAADISSLIAVPLLAQGDLLGGIVLISSSGSRPYGPSDLRVAEELARRAALAMANARLYEAARHATAVRDEVVSLVAHDLRNPLNAITLSGEALRRLSEDLRRQSDPAARRLGRPVESITHAAARMNRLIQDLLDVTRIEAHGLSVEKAPVAVARVIAEVLDSQRSLAAAASVELAAELPAWLPAVSADRDRVLQVLENLIGNAVKFTPAGGRVVLRAEPRDREVVFQVADTGSGIPPEALAHAFDRFWQARAQRAGGAGLGLAIVKGIVEAHGGRTWIESELGRGTTVFFTLPLAETAQPALEHLPG